MNSVPITARISSRFSDPFQVRLEASSYPHSEPALAPIPLLSLILPTSPTYKVSHAPANPIKKTGDFYDSDVRPRIRLSSRWLERAGFKPGRVKVDWIEDGVLSLRVIQAAKPAE